MKQNESLTDGKFLAEIPPFSIDWVWVCGVISHLEPKTPLGLDGLLLSFLCQQKITTVSAQELSELQICVVCSVESEVLQCQSFAVIL